MLVIVYCILNSINLEMKQRVRGMRESVKCGW